MKKINVFAFEDFNTKGLEGDDRGGSLKNLVFDEGLSDNKPDNALGGFGIGKNSFFALTSLQTVFYSSFHKDRGHSFIGVSKLAEFIDDDQNRKSGRVYYGDWHNDRVKPITDEFSIPSMFKRYENGLSSYALGVGDDPKWKDNVTKALIKNYWFLLENDKLEAEVDGEIINKENYLDYAHNVFSDDSSILAFIETFKEPNYEFQYDVHEIGEIKILISEQQEQSKIEYPNKIVFIRDGMMIMEYNIRMRNLPNNVSGIIFCENKKGNKILSNMEPPAHDKFVPHLLEKKHQTLKESDGKKILNQINKYRTESLIEIKNTYNKPTRNVDFVDELLSGMSMSNGQGVSVGKNTNSEDEAFNFAKKEIDINFEFYSSKPNIIVNNIEDDADKDKGGRSEKNKSDKEKGNGISNGAGIGDGLDGKRKVRNRIRKNKVISSAKFYFSHTDENNLNHYVLIVYTSNDIKDVSLKFTQHGDSPAKAISTELIEVSNNSGKLKFNDHSTFYEIIGMNLKSKIKNRYKIVFKEDFKSAFKILK